MVTPIEEFERFAERLYNYAASEGRTIQGKLDFDNAYTDYMEGYERDSKLKDKAWDIIKNDYVSSNVGGGGAGDGKSDNGDKSQKGKGKKSGGRIKVQKIKEQPKEDYLAQIWNKKTNHYQVTTVRGVIGKNGKLSYWKGGKRVQVIKVHKLK
jgi:hypothetical protein